MVRAKTRRTRRCCSEPKAHSIPVTLFLAQPKGDKAASPQAQPLRALRVFARNSPIAQASAFARRRDHPHPTAPRRLQRQGSVSFPLQGGREGCRRANTPAGEAGLTPQGVSGRAGRRLRGPYSRTGLGCAIYGANGWKASHCSFQLGPSSEAVTVRARKRAVSKPWRHTSSFCNRVEARAAIRSLLAAVAAPGSVGRWPIAGAESEALDRPRTRR